MGIFSEIHDTSQQQRSWRRKLLWGALAIFVAWGAGRILDVVAPGVFTALTELLSWVLALPVGWFGLGVGLYLIAAFSWSVYQYRRSLRVPHRQGAR